MVYLFAESMDLEFVFRSTSERSRILRVFFQLGG